MQEIEIWIDVMFIENDASAFACVLFGRHRLPLRPMIGESLSYYQEKGSSHEFFLRTAIGYMKSHSISSEICEINHYAVRQGDAVVYNTSVRLEPIHTRSLADAKTVYAFMTGQHNFEIDPYATNRIES